MRYFINYLIFFSLFYIGCNQYQETKKEEFCLANEWQDDYAFILFSSADSLNDSWSKIYISKDSCYFIDGFVDHFNKIYFTLNKAELKDLILNLKKNDFLNIHTHDYKEGVNEIIGYFRLCLTSKNFNHDLYVSHEGEEFSYHQNFDNIVRYVYEICHSKLKNQN